MIRKKLKKIIEDSDTRAGRIFDISIQILIIISLVSLAFESLPNTFTLLKDYLYLTEIIIIILFTIEYVLRIFVSDKKISFIFSYYGIIDLIAIIPFYLSLGIDLRSIRIVRFIQIFRVLKLARYRKAIERFHQAFIIVREELILFTISAFILIYISSVGIYYFESEIQPDHFSSIFHSLWWSVITLTTVGYGDVYPVTVGGRIFTSIILFIGIGIVAIPAGLIASALSKVRQEKSDE